MPDANTAQLLADAARLEAYVTGLASADPAGPSAESLLRARQLEARRRAPVFLKAAPVEQHVDAGDARPRSVVRRYAIGGTDLLIGDDADSDSVEWIAHELCHDDYGLGRIRFLPGDVVVDVGAHVGVVSLYLAKRHPDVRIIALEPDPSNFRNLCENLARNGVGNVRPENLAVTGDGRPFPISAPPSNSGGCGGFNNPADDYRHAVARSATLDDVFANHAITTCQLLKMDCEGAEHEILATTRVLDRVQWFAGEFHINQKLLSMGHSSVDSIGTVHAHIDPQRAAIRAVLICD